MLSLAKHFLRRIFSEERSSFARLFYSFLLTEKYLLFAEEKMCAEWKGMRCCLNLIGFNFLVACFHPIKWSGWCREGAFE